MPTTRPRYTMTDTGHLAEILDLAARRWPDIDRKQLLLRLVEEGHDALVERDARRQRSSRSERFHRACTRIPSLIDSSVLLSDEAWR